MPGHDLTTRVARTRAHRATRRCRTDLRTARAPPGWQSAHTRPGGPEQALRKIGTGWIVRNQEFEGAPLPDNRIAEFEQDALSLGAGSELATLKIVARKPGAPDGAASSYGSLTTSSMVALLSAAAGSISNTPRRGNEAAPNRSDCRALQRTSQHRNSNVCVDTQRTPADPQNQGMCRPGDGAGDDQTLDLARALEDRVDHRAVPAAYRHVA